MKKKTKIYRLFEIIPGALVWSALILGITLSFVKPLWVIYFIIVFAVYWLFRVLYFIFYVLLCWRKYEAAQKIDWFEKTKKLENWEDIYHLVVLPMSIEPYEVIDTTFQGLLKSNYPKDKMIVVLAAEERCGVEKFNTISKKINEKYGKEILKIIHTLHPDGIVGEMKGKGANAHWGGVEAKKVIDEMGIPYENIIVSYFDSDTAVAEQYFAHLAYKYLTHPNPTRSSYQPVVLYNNNIWDAPSFTRIAAFGTVFWLMTELMKPEKLFTFSSHSMPFKALVDVGFWETDIVSDDSRIFLQCFVHYNGEYEVTPLYIPVSMDTVSSGSYTRTLYNLYKQQRRWAWGVENIPYMMWHFWCSDRSIPKKQQAFFLFIQIEGMFSWVTAPLMLFILGNLPLWVIAQNPQPEVVIQHAPQTLNFLMTAAMIGIIVSAALSLFLLPHRPEKHGKTRFIGMILQWVLLPISLIIFGSIPALEAQTRLMTGKYLGFWVTEKTRD